MKCANPKCGREFEPDKKHKNQKCCSAKCSSLAWYYQNREKRLKRNRQYREEHREEILLKKKIYRITGTYPKGKLK